MEIYLFIFAGHSFLMVFNFLTLHFDNLFT